MTSSPKGKAIERLQSLLSRVDGLKQLTDSSPEFTKWRRDVKTAIANVFENKPQYVEEFESIRYWPMVFISGMPDSDSQKAYVQGLDNAASMLESMIYEIKEYWEDDQRAPVQSSESHSSNRVFVVHGRDNGAKDAVARFITKLELEPVVLHEQANQGRTIIEKFEQYSDVCFAVVLLTPDDICRYADDSEDSQLRARQNVILELGFFLGKLGRNRTCALRKDDVEIPSDYDGILYIDMDSQGAWETKLVRELKGAGIEVDANRAL